MFKYSMLVAVIAAGALGQPASPAIVSAMVIAPEAAGVSRPTVSRTQTVEESDDLALPLVAPAIKRKHRHGSTSAASAFFAAPSISTGQVLAHLSIRSRQAGVRILIDNTDSGQVTPIDNPIAVIGGERLVTLVAPNGERKRFAVAVDPGSSLWLEAF